MKSQYHSDYWCSDMDHFFPGFMIGWICGILVMCFYYACYNSRNKQ